MGDAVEAEPVAAELQAHDVLAPVGRQVDDLEKARVQDESLPKRAPAW